MFRKKIIPYLSLRVLFIIAFISFGCSTVKKKAVLPESGMKAGRESSAKKIARQFTDDVVVFLNLHQIDLDNDGQKDIVALYTTRDANSRGVKVIKVRNGKGNIIYKHIFNNPFATMEIKKEIPRIIVKERSTAMFFSPISIYRWNGQMFVSEKRYKP